MQREEILKKLREQGCRITKQRQLLLDIILQEEYSCCKEIYYKAAKQDSSIGIAAVGEDWHKIYDYALTHDFRFLSYGDSSLLEVKKS